MRSSQARFRGVVMFLAMVGCSTGQDCTAIGCVDAVIVEAPPGLANPAEGKLLVCLDGSCKDAAFPDGRGINQTEVAFPEMNAGSSVSAVLELPDGTRYEGEATVKSTQPNGPGCEPICLQASLDLAAT